RLAAMVRVNCEALVALTGLMLPDLVAQGAGVVLNVASAAAFQPTPFMAVYGASKAFVLSFTESLAEELLGTGVSATALCPGPVGTEFGEISGSRGRWKRPPGEITAEACARYGIRAASRGKVIAVPGRLNRI